MLEMLIEDIGQKLSHQPFEWKSWWWGIKWETFIDIYPQLTEENPLWQREESHLENIRLCGLPPDELQEEIVLYWEKPFWRRWLLSFFTDIDSKIVIWSYYKRCLSFRIIHKENPALEQRLMVYDPEQRLVTHLINQLKQDHEKLEKRLERHTGNIQWVEKNLSTLLAKHEKKRQRFFVKLLSKHLKALPAECDQDSVRKKLEEEYQGLEKMLRNYVEKACGANVSQHASLPPIEENLNRDLVYVGPAVVSENSIASRAEIDPSSSVSEVTHWVNSIRTKIEERLKEEPPSYEAIQSLLKENLDNLQVFIQPHLNNYQALVNEALRGVSRERLKALKSLEDRLSTLTSFFRSSVLLFHPDKSYGDERLRLIKTELFKEFQQFVEDSLKKLHQGLKILKRRVPGWEINSNKRQEESERDRRQFQEWMDGFARMEARNAEISALYARMEARNAEMEARNAEMEEALSSILRQLNLLAEKPIPEHQEEPMEYTSFLPRP